MNTVFKFGFFAALGAIGLHALLYVAGISESTLGQSIQILDVATYALCITFGVLEVRKENGGHITFGKAFGQGILISAAALFIVGTYIFFYYKFINLDAIDIMFSNMMKNKAAMISFGMKDKDFDKMREEMTPATFAWGVFIKNMIMNAITTLIVALSVKKPAPEENL